MWGLGVTVGYSVGILAKEKVAGKYGTYQNGI